MREREDWFKGGQVMVGMFVVEEPASPQARQAYYMTERERERARDEAVRCVCVCWLAGLRLSLPARCWPRAADERSKSIQCLHPHHRLRSLADKSFNRTRHHSPSSLSLLSSTRSKVKTKPALITTLKRLDRPSTTSEDLNSFPPISIATHVSFS